MRCEDVSLLLSESAESDASLPRSIARHAESCLRCQAEKAQYRRIRRTMIAMRSTRVDPGLSMVGEVMQLVREDTALEGADGTERSGDRRRAAYVAAAATAATAATAAGAIVLATRAKRPAS